MCRKCTEIDATISRYRRLQYQITDMRALRAAADLIVKLEAEKQDLHPKAAGG
jgi:hypothetical protein